MGEVWSKTCGQGRDTRDQLAISLAPLEECNPDANGIGLQFSALSPAGSAAALSSASIAISSCPKFRLKSPNFIYKSSKIV